MTFKVKSEPCKTCIYRADLAWDLKHLEDQVRETHRGATGFQGYRVCHDQPRRGKACCRGFWNAHKDEFALGQIAQRLNLVEFVK